MSTLDTHPDFDQIIGITAERIGILPILVRKDYWVTRILRAIATDPVLRHQVIFKGGTSLSKGWRLIDRFSEDIDLLTTGKDFSDLPGKNDRERIFKAIKSRVELETPLRLPELDNLPPEDKAFLYARFSYHCNLRYPLPGMTIANKSAFSDFVFLEMGFRGGKHPHLSVLMNSFVGEMILSLDDRQRSELATYEADFSPFEMELLDPTRTFIEKILAVHCALISGIENVRTRHYYDLASLYTKSESVRNSLQSQAFSELVKDAVGITIAYFDSALDSDLKLDVGPALNLTPEQMRILQTHYENERQYYFQGQPPFEEIVEVTKEIRRDLQKSLS